MGNPGHGAMRQWYHMFLEFYNGALAMQVLPFHAWLHWTQAKR